MLCGQFQEFTSNLANLIPSVHENEGHRSGPVRMETEIMFPGLLPQSTADITKWAAARDSICRECDRLDGM